MSGDLFSELKRRKVFSTDRSAGGNRIIFGVGVVLAAAARTCAPGDERTTLP